MGIAEYNRKRNFKKTPEPRGRQSRLRGKNLHFVVQKHDASHLHYDFRLELEDVLLSWAVPKGPSLNPRDKRLAMQTEDHPLSYIDFEGTIPEGSYGAGDVIVWDTGLYTSSETASPEEARKRIKSGLHKGEIKFVLMGEKLRGAFTLVKMKNDKKQNTWLLVKERDEYASTKDVTKDVRSVLGESVLPRDAEGARHTSFGTPPTVREQSKESAVSKKKAANIREVPQRGMPRARKNTDLIPRDIKPMLAKLVAESFDAPDWFFEVKWDGYRAIAEIENRTVRLYSRHGQSFNETYAPILKALEKIPHDCVLDGEIIALKNGKPDFHTLQQYRKKTAPLQYVLFDLLYLDGEDLRNRPLRERKDRLREIMPEHPQLLFSEHVEENGKDFFRVMQKQNMEGMIAKNAESSYRENSRKGEWRKVKNIREQEAIIVGFTQPRGSRKNLGALVLGAYIDNKLTYIGHSGGGFTQSELRDMCRTLEKIKIAHSPFDANVPVNAPVTWVKPRYVCSVQFTEWTPEDHMRHPIYRGLRVDKSPREVTREIPAAIRGMKKTARKKSSPIELTNLDKIFWPKEGYTKGDLISYYEYIADTILPYLKDRPENLNRNPNGIGAKGFFQKNYESELPDFVETAMIHSQSRGRDDRYIVCNNKETLLFLANLGCIELNPWNSRVQSLEKPDYMVIDLDPGENTFDELVAVAQEVHRILEMACEEHFVKTSGQTGLHIYVPLGAQYSYDEIREFSHLLVRIVRERLPDLTSIERSPAKRTKKIYLDYLQNRFGQTIAAPYSVRPFPGATVSTPLEWREVKKGLDPAKFTIKTIRKRLEKKGDLWKPILQKKVDLTESIRCLQEEFGD